MDKAGFDVEYPSFLMLPAILSSIFLTKRPTKEGSSSRSETTKYLIQNNFNRDTVVPSIAIFNFSGLGQC